MNTPIVSSLQKVIHILQRRIRDERGNIESALVLIPLLFLFLCSAQLISTIFLRNSAMINVQSQASTRAISGQAQNGDSVISIATSDRFQNLRLLIVSEVRELPTLVPGLSDFINKKLESDVKGVAVIEARQ